MCHGTYGLAPGLLLRLHGVAVEHPAAPLALGGARPLDPLGVLELAAVVRQHESEQAAEGLQPHRPLHLVELGHRGRLRLLRHQQRKLRLARPGVQREQALRVAGPAADGVHLAGARPLAFGDRQERLVGALGAVVCGPPGPLLPAWLVSHLAPQLRVAHAAVALLHPPVDRGLADAHLPRPGLRYLLRRQAPREVGPDERDRELEALPVHVHAAAGPDLVLVGERLRVVGQVLAPPPVRAPHAAVAAAVAAEGPAQQLRAGAPALRVPAVGALHVVALARAPGDDAVPHHLVVHRGRGPSQVPCHGPAALTPVQPALYRPPLPDVESVVPLLSLSLCQLCVLSRGRADARHSRKDALPCRTYPYAY